ncbi:hypothetical protein EXE58_06440 [Nocardioides seonyuensis]|uniref:Peptidase S8/S53 domain-containing protein n=1 Tax=Nocardioides seonyuensis TaxID=2518371 RepID=A0A4P7IDB0_9ACTN|nr:S8 family serine peptidase [Nocardioides seonyuensis]QBX55129.1 hypothetical protein EXE58_06440 [Nocardioides seonyuensis]
MKRGTTRRLVALTAALATASTGALMAPGSAGASPELAPTSLATPTAVPTDEAGNGKVIVAFADGVVPAGALGVLRDLGVERAIELPSIGAVAVTADLPVVDLLAAVPGVVAVEPQRRLVSYLYASKEQINANGLDQPAGYTTRVGRRRVAGTRPGVTGEGVTVAVLDSGIFAGHPDFGDRVVKGLNFSYSEVSQQAGFSAEQWDTYAESTGTLALQDEIGHGTHVASTVGGDGSMSAAQGGPDLAGVAPDASFISMRVATPGFGTVDDIDWEEAALAAFDWTIRHRDEHGIDITQNSWGLLPTEPNCLGLDCGEPTDFDAMSRMIASVVDSGVHVVFSAGNDGPEPGTIGGYHDPANGAVLVGAACKSVDSSGCVEGQQMTDFSSRGVADGTGPQVDVVAPGDTIMAALSPSVLAPLTECAEIQTPGYFCISGTSMASPHVSGVVALMLEANPQATPAQVKDCLLSTAVDMMSTGFDIHSGQGMVDAEAAVTCAHAHTVTKTRG